VKIRAAAIGLLLAVLSPLMFSGSPTSAEDVTESTTTVISVSPTEVTYPGAVTFSATVTGNFPVPSAANDVVVTPGSVAFTSGATPICTASLASVSAGEVAGSCSATTANLALGLQTITGNYSGGSACACAESEGWGLGTSSGTNFLTVGDASPPTVTGISPTSGPTTGGTEVIVTGTNLTGTDDVQFGPFLGISTITPVSSTEIEVESPACSAVCAGGAGETVPVTVATSGGGPSSASPNANFTYLPVTVTNVTVSPSAVTVGAVVTYAAIVTDGGGPYPTGSVSFTDGLIPLCTTAPLEGGFGGGIGQCNSTEAAVGNDTITATYAGDDYPSSGTQTLNVSGPSQPPPPPPVVIPPTPAPTPTPSPTPTPPVVTSPSSTVSHGYWLVGSDGGIFSFGNAQFYGSTGSLRLQRPVVGITPTAGDLGYWLVASDGGIFSFGTAGFYGSIPGLGIAPFGSGAPRSLNAPIIGMVPSADGGGYFMVGADGGVFTFGDAKFEGSCPGIGGCPGGAAVAVVPDGTGNGYWVVTQGGYVIPFGDAPSPGEPAVSGVVAAVRSYDGGGYYLLYANGVVYSAGDAVNYGSAVNEVGGFNPASAIFTTSDGGGYWIASANGSVVTEGDAPYEGGANTLHLNGAIIAGTGW